MSSIKGVRSFLDKHPLPFELAYSAIFNVFRFFGLVRWPLFEFAWGYALSIARAGYWRPKLKKMGKGVRIDSGFLLRGDPTNLAIGDYSHIDTNVHLEMLAPSPLRIGKHVHISPKVHIQTGGEVVIGDFAGIAAGTLIYAQSNTYKAPDGREKHILLSMSGSAPRELQYVKHEPVMIEDYAFVGANCVVLPGVRIGKGAVIGSGSVVSSDIPDYMIAVGAPAKPIKRRVTPDAV